MNKESFKILLKSFLVWRIVLFVIVILALAIVPLQKDFLGGGMDRYLRNPYLWSWVNFDGEHYLSVANQGYLPLTYFYFPVYPLAVKLLARVFDSSLLHLATTGLLLSTASLILALVGLWKLIRLDFRENIGKLALVLLLLFPTSFYFVSFYTESMFLALVVWSFYFARQKRWLIAGMLGALATATRVVGITLLPALIIEYWFQRKAGDKKINTKELFGVLLIPVGLLAYMYYLNASTGDPFEFFHSVGIFGQQRSSSFVLLPQVFYRYFVRIIPHIDYSFFPVVFTTFLEVLVALVFLILSILSFVKLRLSYGVYLALGYAIPTLSGSFSSLPRYVLVLFPAFILASTYVAKLPKVLQIVIFLLLFVGLSISTSYFVRGFWIS